MTSHPCFFRSRMVFVTAGCYATVVTIRFPLCKFAKQAPFIAKLSDSVPPDVK